MGALEELKRYTKLMVFGAVDIAIGIFLFFPIMAGYSYALMKVAGSGVCMMIFRAVFLAIIPFILKHVDIFLDIVNVTLVFFDIFIDLVILIIDFVTHYVHDLIDVVNDAAHILGAGKLPFNIPALSLHFVKIETISRQAFKRFLTNIETTCPAYDSADKIFYFVSRDTFNSFSCPLVRYTYPVRWIFDVMVSLFSWSYHGSAAPLVDHPGANCDGGRYGTPDYVCVGLGVGFFITEVLVPMIFLFVILILIGKGLISLLRVAIFVTFKGLGYLEALTMFGIEMVESLTNEIIFDAVLLFGKRTQRMGMYIMSMMKRFFVYFLFSPVLLIVDRIHSKKKKV